MRRGKIIVMTGIPGSGKTTVCNELLKLAEENGLKVKVVNFGTVMVELSEEIGKGMHRDDLRKSSLEFQKRLQAEAARRIANMIKEVDGHIIVDTHMSIKTPTGYLAGLPKHVLEELNPDCFVLVEAEAEEILRRRIKDETRRRDIEALEQVKEELQFSRLMAAACAVLTGSSVKIVKNPRGGQTEAAREVLKVLLR